MANKKQIDFINKIGELARKDMQSSGVLASLTIAQAILESGWGTSGLTIKANALFGIKATKSWRGKVYNAKTKECYNGVDFTTITAVFRAYDSLEDSIKDHSKLLTELSRYKKVVGEIDYKKACVAIQQAGYATDPQYSRKLIQIIEANQLYNFDKALEVSGKTKPKGGKMKSSVFIEKLKDIEANYKTLYVMGCFGAPLTGANINRYCKNHKYNRNYKRTQMIRNAGNKKPPVFGFDCVNLIKGVLWGWNGDAGQIYGGAKYNTAGVPDTNADGMIRLCKDVSTNFSNIQPGEAVWLPGHIGIYIGGGKVIEASPAFKNRVQITACSNVGHTQGMNERSWKKHGKLPYIEYDLSDTKVDSTKPVAKADKSITEIANEVLQGKWGNGVDRKNRLMKAGYNYNSVQSEVNRIVKSNKNKQSVLEVAKEVLQGEWGNGIERKRRLEQAGYNYNAVQAEVNKLLK